MCHMFKTNCVVTGSVHSLILYSSASFEMLGFVLLDRSSFIKARRTCPWRRSLSISVSCCTFTASCSSQIWPGHSSWLTAVNFIIIIIIIAVRQSTAELLERSQQTRRTLVSICRPKDDFHGALSTQPVRSSRQNWNLSDIGNRRIPAVKPFCNVPAEMCWSWTARW